MSRSWFPIRKAFAAALAAAWVSSLGLAFAAGPKVEVSILVEREVVREDASGKREVVRELVRAASAGDVLVYTLTARNAGDGPAIDPRIEDPIPAGTILVLDSLENDGTVPTASLDGGKAWQPFPAVIEKRGTDGSTETVPAPAEAYTHLRWTLPGPLGPGESKDVRFKVRIR